MRNTKSKTLKPEQKLLMQLNNFILNVGVIYGVSVNDIKGEMTSSYLVSIRAKIVRSLKDEWNLNDWKMIGKLLNRTPRNCRYLYTKYVDKQFKIPDDPMKSFKG